MDGPGKVANDARRQMNREKYGYYARANSTHMHYEVRNLHRVQLVATR